ncbi:MAG: DUF3592 domain-containing protein [Candidatus Thiodiazotropha sp. (ex Lucinoma borealis)]|nr:DUF3592 domain-containing protein [Candidatus Thiodiazotropha sp. (ex Lucinoma borealis)]
MVGRGADSTSWPIIYQLHLLSETAFYLIVISIYFSYHLKEKITKWPVCRGTLISSNVISKNRDLDPKFVVYIPTLDYKYTIEGINYRGNNLSVDEKSYVFYDIDQANDLIRSLGSSFNVHYDSENHNVSCIYPDVSRQRRKHYYGILGSGIVLILFLASSYFFLK